MKYQRLKSIDGSGTIMRYYPLAEGEVAYTNCFFGIDADGKAHKISGTIYSGGDTATYGQVGFSHGGNALVDGCILLDINPGVVYMGIFEEGEADRPVIGSLVNGYQRVIDTHYDGDAGVSGKGTLPEEWGIEVLDNPYYLFRLACYSNDTDSVTDTDAGTLTPHQKGVTP